MIKCTKTSTKFANLIKRKDIDLLIDEYKRIISLFVDLLWNEDKIQQFIPREITSKIETWLSARMIQCAGKQASGIVRGTKKKQQQRLWVINKLNKEGRLKQARKLQRIYNNIKISKPEIDNVEMELDSRFVKIDLDNSTSFDGWVTIVSIGNKQKIQIPFKKTKHFNKLNAIGTMKDGIRLSKKNITFNFDIKEPAKKQDGEVLGIDIGQTTTLSCSNDFSTRLNRHKHDLNSINSILARKKKGSKAFQRAQQHRTNYINWSINQLNLTGIRQVNIENIKNLRKGRRSSRKLSHWTYADIFRKLESACKNNGVLVVKKNPTYTSQRCSQCGWTRKSNRNGKLFKCGSCGFTYDSDLNASRNIALELTSIPKKQRLKRQNLKGFFWNAEGQEPIVPVVQKENSSLKNSIS